MSELKDCPFCGGDAELDTARAYRALDNGKIGASVAVYCRGCPADVGVCIEDFHGVPVEDLVSLVRNAWNARAPQGAVEILRQLRDRMLKVNGQALCVALVERQIHELEGGHDGGSKTEGTAAAVSEPAPQDSGQRKA